MTVTPRSNVGNPEFCDQRRTRAMQTVCMALVLASTILLVRAVSLL
jgi:hypothetical protein